MYILLNEAKEVIGRTELVSIFNATDSEIIEVEVVPENLVGNYSYIDGEFIPLT